MPDDRNSGPEFQLRIVLVKRQVLVASRRAAQISSIKRFGMIGEDITLSQMAYIQMPDHSVSTSVSIDQEMNTDTVRG